MKNLILQIKNNKVFNVFRATPRVINTIFSFPTKVLRNTIALREIDSRAPFSGELASNGIFHTDITSRSIKVLEKLLTMQEKKTKFTIFLKKDDEKAINEIFDILKPIVRSYLGKESYLDGINWAITHPGRSSVSGSWHTDNVGNRLKCFICVKGDGTAPTVIMPSRERYPKVSTVIRMTAIELIRRIGLKAEFNMDSEFLAKHKTQSLYIFDTQLLHRGGYESVQNDRVIFLLEFSDRRKHNIVKTGLGTRPENSFCFHKDLEKESSFISMLDKDRVSKFDNDFYVYQTRQ